MKQDILKALSGDEVKYNLIMQKTQQPDIARERWKVWQYLNDLKHSPSEIAKYFGKTPSTVLYGLKKMKEPEDNSKKITAVLMREIYKSIPKDKSGLVIEALRLKGYQFRDIGTYLKINFSTARSRMQVAVENRDFEERRKRIYKF